MKKTLLIFVISYFISITLQSQTLTEKDVTYFKKYEDSLAAMQQKVFFSKTDTAKFKANAKFFHLMEEVLLNNLSFSYPFDSLKEVNRLVSPDKKFRLITWSIPTKEGTFFYFGLLQALHPKTKKYEVYELNDKSNVVKNPESYQSDNNKWFGMLYYSIIPCGDYYTLLGWDGNDKLTARKFIDILSFKKDGSPVFGKEVFKMPKKYPKRIMFEYNAQVVMTLRYSPEANSVIFDHLTPKESYLEGQAQFYGPDFSYDAFVFSHGKWEFEEEVDAKNPRSKTDNYKRDKNQKEKLIYTPK